MRTLTLLLSLLLVGCATLPASSPTATLALDLPPNARLLDGTDIRYGNIRFFLDPGLGVRLFVFDQTLTSPSGQAAYSTLFSLTPDEECQDWCIVVYPVREFEQAFGTFIFPPGGYGGGAAVIFHAQESAVDFQNGNGARALEMFGQISYFVNNDALKYAFRGYTPDGHFAVYVQIPVRSEKLSALPPTLTAADPITVSPAPAFMNIKLRFRCKTAAKFFLTSQNSPPILHPPKSNVLSIYFGRVAIRASGSFNIQSVT
jgi:hypothetical protein